MDMDASLPPSVAGKNRGAAATRHDASSVDSHASARGTLSQGLAFAALAAVLLLPLFVAMCSHASDSEAGGRPEKPTSDILTAGH